MVCCQNQTSKLMELPLKNRAMADNSSLGRQTKVIAATGAVLITLLGCTADYRAHKVTLSWDPSSSAVMGYNVYRGGQSGGPYTKLNPSLVTATEYIDIVQPGHTYFYVVKSVDWKNIQSAPSEEISAPIPGNSLLRGAEAARKLGVKVLPTRLLRAGLYRLQAGLKKLQRGYDDAR